MARALVACILPALAITIAWVRVEEPARVGEALAVAAVALVPALVPGGWKRALAAVAALAGFAWIAYGTEPWELLPFRDERIVVPVVNAIGEGVAGFYTTLLPFETPESQEMHALVLSAVFGFVIGTSLLTAASKPFWAVAVAVVGVCWPATLMGGQTVLLGSLALAAALSIPLVLRSRSGPSLVAGVAAAAVVVAGAAWASAATNVAREAALDWEAWDFGGLPAATAPGVRFVWDSNYDGVEFPAKKTVVLTIEGPETARYWRASTLDVFADDHWFENHLWLGRAEPDGDPLPRDRFTPARALRPESWVEQRIEVKALVDDHLAAAGTPVAVDMSSGGAVFRLSGGVLRVLEPLGSGARYRVWSYAPDPAPAALDASPPRYPAAAARYRSFASRQFPVFGARGRDEVVRQFFEDPSYEPSRPYAALYETARRVVGEPSTPYAAVLALESWFRQRGGFRYEESPPRAQGPPLVDFVTRTRAGYCQHYAGAMALMLRMLGVPARVAVGFTSGTLKGGEWVVTDHEAHAWVEVWFRGHGWVPFDPTPGRGTFGGSYSFASDSAAAVAALDRGDLDRAGDARPVDPPDRADSRSGDIGAGGEGPSLFAFALVAAALWVLLVGLVKTMRRRLRYLTGDPRRSATASRRELEAFLRDQGIAVPLNATLADLRRVTGEGLGLDCRSFAEAAARARFGPPEATARGASAARRELRALLRRARLELSLWARFRGFVSLRSLRGSW